MSQGWSVDATPDSTIELVTNGDFSTTSSWVLAGSSASIASGKLTLGGGFGVATAEQDVGAQAGQMYRLVFTVVTSSGDALNSVKIGDASFAIPGVGTFTLDLVPGAAGPLHFASGPASGLEVDDVSVKQMDTITFNDAPAAGTNNITVREIGSAAYNATPVFAVGAWNGAYGFPGEIEFFSDRLVFGSTLAQPQTIWLSRTGDYSMFGKSTPIVDDDAIVATMNARQLNRVVDLIPKQHLLALTTGGVWKISGGDSEVLTPSTLSAKPQPSAGAANLPALDVGETAVYLTNKGGQVRDLAFTFEADGYAGSDLTAFAAHLLEHRSLIDWAYADVPYSMVVAVGDDGIALSMTYKREHQVVAWAWHDTAGSFESVCSIPEDGETGVYVLVQRTVNGAQVRYVERFANARGDDLRERVGVDAALSYDGRHTGAVSMTLAGGATADDVVTITASGAAFGVSGVGFVASNVNDALVLDYDGEPLQVRIASVQSATQATGYASRPLTAADLAPGTAWALAVDGVGGLEHLEGCTVQIAADGEDRGSAVVTAGAVSLDPPGVLVHVGLGYVSEFESLNLTVVGGESVGTRNKLISEVGVLVKDTRGIEVGTSFAHMSVLKPRDGEAMTQAPRARTEWLSLPVSGEWARNPTVCIRNAGPIPHTVLAIEPDVQFGR